MRVINVLLLLQILTLPSVSLESTGDDKAMDLPEQNPPTNDSCEPDSISLLQASLSQLNRTYQANLPLKSVGTTHVDSSQKQAKRTNSLSSIQVNRMTSRIRDVSSSAGAIVLVCVAVLLAVAVSAFVVYSHFESNPPGKTAENQIDARPFKAHQRPTGVTCCGDGVASLMRSQRDRALSSKKLPHPAVESTLEDSAPWGIGTFTPDCMVRGHPNFSGSWRCSKVEGAVDNVLADLGLGYFARSAIIAWGCGAGQVVRHYTHQGNHVKMHEQGLADVTQEWDINGKEQEINTKEPYLQSAHWDEENPLVLVIQATDLKKEAPATWTTTKMYFIDSRSFAYQVSSSSGSTCRWLYERLAEVSDDP